MNRDNAQPNVAKDTMKHFCDLSSEGIRTYVASLGSFASAQIAFSRAGDARDQHDALGALRATAALVQVDCVSGVTIDALASRIYKSQRSSMIYEQYCDDMARATLSAMTKLNPLVAEALAVHMQLDQLIEDARFVYDAVCEAYDALYGEAELGG